MCFARTVRAGQPRNRIRFPVGTKFFPPEFLDACFKPPSPLLQNILLGVYLLTYFTLLTYLLTYLLTPWSKFLLKKPTGSRIIKKLPAFY